MKGLSIYAGIFLGIILCLPASGQSSKKIREKGIEIITVKEYFIEEGMKDPVVESIEKFNEEGDRVEIQEFNKYGEVKRWEKYEYNKDGKIVKEIYLDGKGRIEHTEVNIYMDGLRVEKQYYNQKDKLYKKKVYEYGYRQ